MKTYQIFLPDDVRHSRFVADGLKGGDDDLIRLERDEWLEFRAPLHPNGGEELANHGRSITTFNSKQRVSWYTNQTSSSKALLQEIEISVKDSSNEVPFRSVWALLPSQTEDGGRQGPFPFFLSGSILNIGCLGRSSLEIPLEHEYEDIYASFLGILLAGKTGKLSLLHHIEEPVIPIQVLGKASNCDEAALPGKIIWTSSTLPFVISYVGDISNGKILLWNLTVDQDENMATLTLLKQKDGMNGIPDIQIVKPEISKTLIVINQPTDHANVLIWCLSRVSLQGEYALDYVYKKVLPIHIDDKYQYFFAQKRDLTLCICSLRGNPILDLSLVKCNGSLVLSATHSCNPTVADRFGDIKDISGCNVTVVLNHGDRDGEHHRVQISWLPLSSWMRNNIDPLYFPLMSDNHQKDWSQILEAGSSSHNETGNRGENCFQDLIESREHSCIMKDVLGAGQCAAGDIDGSSFHDELCLNSLDTQFVDLIMSKNRYGSRNILRNEEFTGQRSRTFSEFSRKLKEFFEACREKDISSFDSSGLLEYLLDNSWTVEDIEKLPFHLALPLLIMLEVCALEADTSHSPDALLLEDRPDLAAALSDLSLEDPLYNPFHSNVLITAVLDNEDVSMNVSEGVDTLQPDLMAHRFGRDTRVFEARELLSSSRPISLHSNESDETGEGSVHQKQLHIASKRTLALAVGRGAMALCTCDALPTELLDSPNIDLSGRIVEKNDAIVTLDLTADPIADGGGALSSKTAWPEFHNGVASALRIKPGGELSRTWIVYNKPENPSYDHAGFLFGLGLTGQLSCLTVTDLYRYLSHEHDATLVGILLGMSSSKRCSMDSTLTKILFLHLPARHPIGYPDLEISPVVQCAALVGLGQIYQGSSQRAIMETLLQEIERTNDDENKNQKQVNDITKRNEAYSLCAGFALGLVCLGRGADQDMEANLHYLLVGGTKSGNISRKSTLSKLNAASRPLKREDFINEMIASSYQNTRNNSGQSSGAVAEELAAAQGAAKTIMEGDLINLNATSPAAALALGLMYLKSGNQRIAEAFYIPESLFGLRMVNPEHICLRIAMKALIMWDCIEPSSTWLKNQIPQILSPSNMDMDQTQFLDSDSQIVFQGSCFATAGCCLGLGLKFAGSQDTQARSLIETCLENMLLRKSRLSQSESYKGVLEVMETCITSLIMSLSVVMAGSGDLRVFSLCRALLNRMPKTINDSTRLNAIFYGSYVGASLSIGFLFMSGGTKTFDTSNESVAYLLMSIFPVLSTSTSDNKSYLQALRHFYVLATRKKITDCVSIRSNQYVDKPRSPDDSGSCVVYIPRDLGDPAISHSINRSFQGFPGPEVDRILNRVGLPPSITGYIHVTGSVAPDEFSLLSSGEMMICSLAQPRLLCHLLKLISKNEQAFVSDNHRRAALDLWLSLAQLGRSSLVKRAIGDCRKSLIALCAKAILPLDKSDR